MGYSDADLPRLVEGTMKQQCLLATAPFRITDVERVLAGSLTLW